MPNICPECGADQPLDAVRCGVCGARMVPAETPPVQIERQEIFSYSLFVIGLILFAIAVPCFIGLLCFFLGR